MSVNPRSALPVSRAAVMRYLSDKGWTRVASRDGRLVKFSLVNDDYSNSIDLIFSVRPDLKLEVSEVNSAIQTLVQLYDLPREEIVNLLMSLSSDIIFSRIPDEYVRHESIDLGMASSYINGMKNLLSSSATTEITGQRFFSRTLKEALSYTKSCRFGHTFRGSFGFVVESPVGYNDSPTMALVDDIAPFGRRVMKRVSTAFESFSLAVEADDPWPLLSEKSGMSANMCDDVIGLIEDTGISKVEISIVMTPEWSDGAVDHRRSYKIEQRYIDILRAASASLRSDEAPKEETIIGRVIRLETDADPQDFSGQAFNREVTISWDSSDFGLIKVQVSLAPMDYLTAVDAHRSGRLFAVSGMLRRKGRGWSLDDASGARSVG